MILIVLFMSAFLAQAAKIDNAFPADGGSDLDRDSFIYQNRGNFAPPPSILELEEVDRVLFSDIRQQDTVLKKVKFYLVNGETRKARVYLNQLTYARTKLTPIAFRYLGVLTFIEGDFAQSYQWLSKPDIQTIPQYGRICMLKVLNEIVLSLTQNLASDWERCKHENPNNFKEDNLIWMETLVQLKLNPYRGVTKVPFKRFKIPAMNQEELKVFLKLALYLNQEQLIIDQIPELGEDQLKDPEVRELAGQVLFRTGALAKSYKFVEDLKSPNSENIKGNLYLLRKKYEVAYAQFKVALEQKQNSQNAMERLLPLAWLLGDWEEGAKYAERVIASPQTQINKLTLLAAFLTQKSDFDQATKVLETIAQRSRRGTEIDVTQIYGFVALMQNRPEMALKQTSASCNQNDLVSCWLYLQLGQWDSFPLSMIRPHKVIIKDDVSTLTQSVVSDPIKETVFVNQLDIEEMDDQLIRLIAN